MNKKQFAFAAVVLLSMAASTMACDRTYVSTYRAQRTTVVYHPVYEARSTDIVVRPTIVTSDPEVRTGSMLQISANFLGKETGFVLLRTADTTHNVPIQTWSATGVVVKLPDMGVTTAVPAQLDVVLPTGQVVKSTRIRLIAPPSLVVFDAQPSATANLAQDVQPMPQAQAATNGLSLQPIPQGSIQNAAFSK